MCVNVSIWGGYKAKGTQPTAGGLHAWVAKGLQFGLQQQLLFSHLKAVYEQILEGHQWVETGINQSTTQHSEIDFLVLEYVQIMSMHTM